MKEVTPEVYLMCAMVVLTFAIATVVGLLVVWGSESLLCDMASAVYLSMMSKYTIL